MEVSVQGNQSRGQDRHPVSLLVILVQAIQALPVIVLLVLQQMDLLMLQSIKQVQ
jgi:hypothetical protein